MTLTLSTIIVLQTIYTLILRYKIIILNRIKNEQHNLISNLILNNNPSESEKDWLKALSKYAKSNEN